MARKARSNGASSGFEEIAKQIGGDFTAELLDALPELDQAVKAGGGEGSCSATLQIKRQKKTRGFTARLSFRVRAPRPPREYDLRIGDTDQLELGFDPRLIDTAEDDAGAGADAH